MKKKVIELTESLILDQKYVIKTGQVRKDDSFAHGALSSHHRVPMMRHARNRRLFLLGPF